MAQNTPKASEVLFLLMYYPYSPLHEYHRGHWRFAPPEASMFALSQRDSASAGARNVDAVVTRRWGHGQFADG